MKLTKLLAALCAVLLMTVSLCACDADDLLNSLKGMFDGDDTGGNGDYFELVPRTDAPEDETEGEAGGIRIDMGDGDNGLAGAQTSITVTVKKGYDAEALTAADFPGLVVESIRPLDGKRALLVISDADYDMLEQVSALPFVEEASLSVTISSEDLPDGFEAIFGYTGDNLLSGN